MQSANVPFTAAHEGCQEECGHGETWLPTDGGHEGPDWAGYIPEDAPSVYELGTHQLVP